MDYRELVRAHVDTGADITVAAQPVGIGDASAMGLFRFDRQGQVVAFEEKPPRARLEEIGSSVHPGTAVAGLSEDKPFVASMGVYVFSRTPLHELLSRDDAKDFGREIIPAALARYRVRTHLFSDYWADVGTVQSFYDANIMLTRPGAPFTFYDPRRPIYTHPRFLPGSRLSDCAVRDVVITEGCYLDRCSVEESIVGIRTTIRPGARVRRSVLLGADFYEAGDEPTDGRPCLGIGRDVVVEGAIVDKNARIGDGARLTNERGCQELNGDGFYIRNGIIVVPKDGVIAPGTVV
jgi:glucose-1-phosphate adenylyltransferase